MRPSRRVLPLLTLVLATMVAGAGPSVAATDDDPPPGHGRFVRDSVLYPNTPDGWACHFLGDCRPAGVRTATDPAAIALVPHGRDAEVICVFGSYAKVTVTPGAAAAPSTSASPSSQAGPMRAGEPPSDRPSGTPSAQVVVPPPSSSTPPSSTPPASPPPSSPPQASPPPVPGEVRPSSGPQPSAPAEPPVLATAENRPAPTPADGSSTATPPSPAGGTPDAGAPPAQAAPTGPTAATGPAAATGPTPTGVAAPRPPTAVTAWAPVDDIETSSAPPSRCGIDQWAW